MGRACQWGARLAGLLYVAGLVGCYHLVEPIQPDRLPPEESEAPLPSGLRIRLVNGYEEPCVRDLGRDGIHYLEADLRDWTARLIVELASELLARGVRARVPPESVRGTSLAGEDEPGSSPLWRLPASRRPEEDEAVPTLRARVLQVRAPSRKEARASPLEAAFESADGTFAAHYAAPPGSAGFRDAFLSLMEEILGDPGFRRWLEIQGGPGERRSLPFVPGPVPRE